MSKFINRLKWHLKELNKTFSNEPSHYSSKRIERALIFINAMILLDLMVWKLLNEDKIDWMGAVGIFGAQMAYAGFQTNKIMKDTSNNTNTNTGDNTLQTSP